uniref:F-box domain-containing protein n=1 Tax=Mycena chlorophos TaxID=658473 RepID=A0ABQ0L779_MYCCL|nr:predicted protein [Mycena chlorophos]
MALFALPVQELWDRIIDHLNDSPSSLCACARTCRAFTWRAQSHIFRAIRAPVEPLDCGEFDEKRALELQRRLARFRRLSRTLLRSPNAAFLVSRVRALQIHASSPEITDILAKVPWTNVRTLHLKNISHVPPAVEAVRALVSIPSLEDLELRFAPTTFGGYRVPETDLAAILVAISPNVRILRLGLCNPYSYGPVRLLSSLTLPPSIQTFILDHSPGIVPLLCAMNDARLGPRFTRITTLHLRNSWSPALDNFLRSCGANVEVLHVDAFGKTLSFNFWSNYSKIWADQGLETLRLDCFPNLRQLVCPNAAEWTPARTLLDKFQHGEAVLVRVQA